MSCGAPHPVRAADGLAIADELEVVGGHATEAWARCRRCGTWFWLSTDVGGKYEYVGAVVLDTVVAERALIHGEVEAVAELVSTYPIPYGPVWTTSLAMVEIFCALTPGAAEEARARALRAHASGPLWNGAAALFERQARGRLHATPPDLAFLVDLRVPGYRFAETHEVGAALVLVPDARDELLRLDERGLVQLPLASHPRWLAARPDAVVFAVPTVDGEVVLVLDGAGTATTQAPSSNRYAVTPLDQGWWLFVPEGMAPERWIELRLPDGRPRVRFRRLCPERSEPLPPARRLGDGWIISNLIDDEGQVQALTRFDAEFATQAYSVGVTGTREVTPIDDRSFWASAEGVMERWVQRDQLLTREQTFAVRSCWVHRDRLICDLGSGQVVARGPDGDPVWTWRWQPSGATYGVATTDGVLLYDDHRAHLLDRDGRVVTSFAIEAPDVLVGSEGTAFLKTLDALWSVRDHATELRVRLDSVLATTCGDRALLAHGDRRFELIGGDGQRAAFTADTSFSVVGSRGGPYLVEADRIRVARFA